MSSLDETIEGSPLPERTRLNLLVEVADLVQARSRDSSAASDGGGSGRSDTNDNTSNQGTPPPQ